MALHERMPWAVRDLVTVLLAFAAGALSGSFSMGGELLMKPGIRALGASPLGAVGTTVPMILPTVAMATYTYHRQGLVDWRAVRWAAPGGVIGAVLGSLLAPRVPGGGHLLQLGTARDAVHRRQDAPRRSTWGGLERQGRTTAHEATFPSGRVGAGGDRIGGVLRPARGRWRGHHGARIQPVARDAADLRDRDFARLRGHLRGTRHDHTRVAGHDRWRFAIVLIVGAVPGAWVGSRLAMRASDRRLEEAVGVMVTIIAIVYAGGELSSLLQ